MNGETTLKVIARIQSPFPGKFGIPRQSGRVPQILSRIVFEPEYRNADALRGLEGFSHLWLLWQFSEAQREGWSPTVRPPRLGGNQRMGVFATRSPYRPNPIGLSCVAIKNIVLSSPEGPYIEVSGADLMDATPIYDIKPYLPMADSIPTATGGFAEPVRGYSLEVQDPDGLLTGIPAEDSALIRAILAEDPRPSYQTDADRVYSFECSGYHISFRVEESKIILCNLK
ncbi:MAG: tRNA (N6-threonylcarbamoyladenosine(37)-N6)-methyltransferase TrmO [Clostridia bacterium]|nr:tRNA (N6-threonylcarbamoyladenosine(37)-N6)-methyltransferase TrmO [Clostridia bacterium]